MNNFSDSRRQFQKLLSLAILVPLASCATASAQETLVVVSKDRFHAFGHDLSTSEELTKMLVARQTKIVDIHPDADAGYEQVGRAIYAVARSGAKVREVVGMVGDR